MDVRVPYMPGRTDLDRFVVCGWQSLVSTTEATNLWTCNGVCAIRCVMDACCCEQRKQTVRLLLESPGPFMAMGSSLRPGQIPE
jgi:hypothetical protein